MDGWLPGEGTGKNGEKVRFSAGCLTGSLQVLFAHRLSSEGSVQEGAWTLPLLAPPAMIACLGISPGPGTAVGWRMEAREIRCHISGMYFLNNKQT